MRRKAEQHDDDPGENVDRVVVRGQHDRCCHRNGPADRENPQRNIRRRPPDGDADEDVPAEVQAREGRVLIGEPRRLKRSVGVRMQRDRVDDCRVREPRRGDGEEREEEEADAA